MFFDSMSLTFSLICLGECNLFARRMILCVEVVLTRCQLGRRAGLFSHLDFQTAQILGSLPFLLMIFLSTTFSPGSGVPVLKVCSPKMPCELRYNAFRCLTDCKTNFKNQRNYVICLLVFTFGAWCPQCKTPWKVVLATSTFCT